MNTRLLKTFVALLMLMPVSLFAQYVAQVTTSGNVTTQYATFSEALNNWGANCTLKLLANVETSSTIAVNSTRTLDLNGYGIRMTGTGAVIAISLGGNLTLNDSDPMAEHHFDVDANSVASLNEASGSLTIYGGYITGGTNNYGGGIDVGSNGTNYQNGPSLTMNAGTIIGNSGRVGGVCVARDDRHYYNTFTMNGGAVCYNNNTGVGVFPDGTFHMNGGTIHHNNTIGIEMWNSKLLTLNNAVITDNNTEGIRVDSRVAAIQVQGRTIVSGNHDYDVFYRRTGTGSRALSIVGELHSEARIGISNLDSYTPNPFTSGLNGRGNASNFFSNDPTMGVGLTANNEAHLASFPTYTAPTVISGLYYTGVAQALVNEGAVSGGTMYYSLDNTNWNTTIPTGTDVGDYTVYYRIVGDASHADVIPSPNTVEVTIVATVSMAEGTADVSNWSLSPTQATAGTTINVDYSGSKTVERAVVRRKYASTIDLNSSNATTAQNSFNSTANSKIVVSQDFNAGLTFTRTEGEIDLNGHANSSWFCVQNNVVGESVTIRNGSFLDIDGIGGWGTCYHGTIILENINCRNVFTDGHDYVIRGGAYENIHNYYNNGTPGTVTIYGGKFKAFNTDGHNPNGTLDGTYTLYGGMYKFDPTTAANCNVIIPNGYSVQLNPDIDNLDYPWVVVKTSDPLAQTSEPSFDLVKVGDNQWTFAMPAYNVEVEVTYVPDMSYTVEMASGTVDATNWNITSSPAQKGATVTLTYNGAMKVENVSLVKKSATQINASNASTMLQSSINSAIEEHPYIVLTDNIPCLGNVFITKPEGTVDLSGYNMCANLYIQNDVLGKTLTLRNGHVQGGADGDGGCPGSRRGTVVLDNLVIDGTLWCDGHEFYIYNTTIGGELQNIQFNNYPSKVTIFSGKFNALRHSCGNITGRGQYMVYGGKFKENYADWNICAPGYSFQANTDEDAATYPYVVKPISPVNAKSAANPKKAPANQPGYGITEVTSNSEWTFTMPASDVEVLVEYGLHGQGTEEDPFTISSADEWNVFAKMVNGGESFAGKFIRQTADISGVTQAVGTGSNRFSGTYDGYEHTLTLDINTNANYAAPFALLSGATIKNLHTDGEINTGGSFAGGIVGEAIDGSTIVNCLSTVTLTSSKAGDCTHGGLIGVSNGTTIEGCVFNGSLYTTNNTINCGGLVGWSQTNQAKTIVTNCLFDPVDFTPSMATNWSSTIGRDGGNSGACYTITNTYYTQAFGYTHQGKLVRSITAGDNVTTLGMAGTATVYNVSGITAYADNNGLKYGDMFFAGDADVVNLTLGHADRTAEGLFFDSYSASNGATIIGDILTVTTNNTIVSANYSQCPILTLNSDGNGTVGFSGGNLPQGVTPGSAANTYYVVPGTEVIIKATPKEHYHLDSWSNGSQVNTDDTIHVIVTTDSTITATFDTNTYVLNVVSADAAMGSVSGSNPAAKHFLSYEISATPNNGYHFVQWNDGNTDNPRTVTLSSDSTFTATFAVTPAELAWSNDDFTGYTYIDFNNWKPTLTNPHNVSVRYGCVEGNQSLQGGILCDAQTGTIGASSSVYGYIHSVAGTYHIYAVHETDQTYYYDSVVYTLHVLPSAQVSLTKNIADGGVVSMPDYTDESTLTHLYITVNGTSYAYVAQGYSMSIMAEPATGYHFSKWTLDQSNLSTNAAYTYQAPATITGNLLLQYIQAVFDTNTYALNVVSADAEMGSVSGSNPEAKHFLSYEISATPNTGYHFVHWSDGNTDNPRMVTLVSDSNITAYFDYNEYTVTYMDGESMLHEETVKYLHSIPEYTTSKEGWRFEGWNPEVPQLMSAENLTVYAQWYRICEPVTDVDNNTYPTVNIGNKCWMAENLRTTHYADGREITKIYEYHSEGSSNVQENVSVYGRLYDWYDAVDSARPTRATRVQGICPDGWFLPNNEDFEILYSVDLQALRSTNYWMFNNGNNSSGFDLRPAGMYNHGTARYENLGGNAYLWSATATSEIEAHCHMADCNCYMLIDLINNKQNAFSVRCVKD